MFLYLMFFTYTFIKVELPRKILLRNDFNAEHSIALRITANTLHVVLTYTA